MNISVFVSYPKPFLSAQKAFVDALEFYLQGRGIGPRTLGVTDYDMDAPLKAIRRLMLECNGLITIALRRIRVDHAVARPAAELPGPTDTMLRDSWLTSPYCHIEPAMAYQIGLPILILREKGVIPDGMLEKGVVGTYMPEFDLTVSPTQYFETKEWRDIIGRWEGFVRGVVETKGNPPKLF